MRLPRLFPRTAVLLSATVLGAGGAAADPADRLAHALLDRSGAPAAGVALWSEDGARTSVAGRRVAGQAVPVEAGDLWHVGSNTKSMTATLVARLAEAGRIGWDDTVGQVLGPVIADIHPAYRDATYVALLQHRAGLPANIGWFASLRLLGSAEGRDLIADRRSYAARVLSRAPVADPAGFAYSNAGYVVAGAMLEQTTGESWESLMRAEVFAPLGLDSAGFGPPGRRGAADQPRGHRKGLTGALRAVEPGPVADNVPALGPAGTVHLSLADMLDYLTAHARPDTGFLSAESWARLHTPPEGGSYAMGWNVSDDGRLGHSGSNTLWFARMAVWPETNRALFLVVNAGGMDRLPKVMDEVQARAFD